MSFATEELASFPPVYVGKKPQMYYYGLSGSSQ